MCVCGIGKRSVFEVFASAGAGDALKPPGMSVRQSTSGGDSWRFRFFFFDVQKNDKKYNPTQRNSPQLHVFSANSTRFGPTPRASVQLHAFRSNSTLCLAGNSTLWRPTPRSLGQLHALPVNSTILRMCVGLTPPKDRFSDQTIHF